MRDFTYVTDVVTAFVLALDLMRSKRAAPDGRGWLFNIAGGSHATVREVLSLLAKVSGREPTVLTLPAQAGDVRQTWADTTRAREVLGYTPVTDLRSGLAHQWLAVSAARTISRSMGAPSHGPSSK
jgi:nucleoside-diphosphate-sugar epimerase